MSTDTPQQTLTRTTDPQDIAVVGGGMAGTLAALVLARDGHRVTVYERDDTDLPDTADEAFDDWDRRGAPHARQSHAILARLRRILRERAPDVLDELLAQGATELSVERILPPDIADREPRPGDDDLVLLCCRRLTIEWVLRRAVTAEAGAKPARGAKRFLAVPSGADTASTKVFQASQCGHLPSHLGLVPPHSLQLKRVLSFAMRCMIRAGHG